MQVLLHNGSPFTISENVKECSTLEVHTAPFASAATSPADIKPELTADAASEPTMMSAPEVMHEPKIVPEPDKKSDQVHEPAKTSVPVDILVE